MTQISKRTGPVRPQGPDIAHLVREIQAGRSRDEHFQQLFVRYYPSAVHFFANRGLPKNDAEDLAQDVLVGVYKGMGRFRLDASFDTWHLTILANVWKNHLRSRSTLEGRAEKVRLDGGNEPAEGERFGMPELRDLAEDPLEQILADERTRLLHEAIDQLPPKMRQCMMLRIGQGLRYREIAEVMGIRVSSVKTHLGTAYERLKPLLEEHFDVFAFEEGAKDREGTRDE